MANLFSSIIAQSEVPDFSDSNLASGTTLYATSITIASGLTVEVPIGLDWAVSPGILSNPFSGSVGQSDGLVASGQLVRCLIY